MRRFPRPAALLVAVAALILSSQAALAGPSMPPEQQTGSVGPYSISDGPALTGAICRYSDTLPLKLRAVVVKPPQVRWPDTSSGNASEHGKIRHTVIVQRSTDGGGSWRFFARSAAQTAGATETTPAALTKRTVAISAPGKHAIFRIVSRIEWIRPNGTVRGTLLHWYANARWASDQLQGTIESGICPVDAAA
ncbi:MAG: hypothetical protein U0869_22925 [Chloroflexota bacterium]